MRVLYFTRDQSPHDHRFLSAIAGGGHEALLLRLERRGPVREARPLPHGVREVAWLGGQRPFRLADAPALTADLRRVLADTQPDVVHAGPVPTCAWLAARAEARPLLSMSWGSDLLVEAGRSAALRRRTEYALARSARLLGDCETVREKAVAFGFSRDRVTLFPWGVDLDRFRPGDDDGLRERLGWQDAFVLLSVRSWEPIYGVETLAQAFARAAAAEPRLRLLLLGTGSLGPHIRRILEEGGVLGKVQFAGQVANPDLPSYYNAADLYVSTSYSDGSSVSLLEALACARPALVSDIPGNREWVAPGQNGWLFPPGDAEALAEAILAAANRPAQTLREIGAANRALAEQRADWRAGARALLSAYETIGKEEWERG